jgi:hypothetical protein
LKTTRRRQEPYLSRLRALGHWLPLLVIGITLTCNPGPVDRGGRDTGEGQSAAIASSPADDPAQARDFEIEQATQPITATAATSLPVVLKNAGQAGAGWWQPPPRATWQWQLTGSSIDVSLDAQAYDVDLFDVDAAVVTTLHAQGRSAICYLSAGSREDWRPDADQFPASVIGKDYAGWPGEQWLDIRQIDLLAPIMRARLDLCRAKGFDAVEPDNVDGYTNDTGFPLTYQDQLAYNTWFAAQAHARGLSVGLKNDGEQALDLAPHFDWAMTEDCYADGWCDEIAPFTAAGKAVFAAEYTDRVTEGQFVEIICPQAGARGLSAILKHRDLDAWRLACP